MLLNLEFEDFNCIKLLISKLLGIGIVFGYIDLCIYYLSRGAILKVPQIMKIVSARSVAGISFASYLLETICYSISVCYNYRNGMPWTTYGESIFITVQNFIVLLLLMVPLL